MTETQYLKLDDPEVRAEWVARKLVILPWPSIQHIELNGWLVGVLYEFLEHHDMGRVIGPNVMVRFAKQRARRLPDVKVLLKPRLRLLRKYHVEGAPNVIFEIVSGETQSLDRRVKYFESEKAGVREYWIIDQLSERVEAYALSRGRYVEIESEKETWNSTVLPRFYLRSSWLWRKPLPRLLTIQKEMGLLQ